MYIDNEQNKNNIKKMCCEFDDNVWENAVNCLQEQIGLDISQNKVDVLFGKYYLN